MEKDWASYARRVSARAVTHQVQHSNEWISTGDDEETQRLVLTIASYDLGFGKSSIERRNGSTGLS